MKLNQDLCLNFGPLCLWQCFDHTAELHMEDGGTHQRSVPNCKIFDAAAFFSCYSQSSFSFPPPSRPQLITASRKDITGQSSNLPLPRFLIPPPCGKSPLSLKSCNFREGGTISQSQRRLWMFELKEPKVQSVGSHRVRFIKIFNFALCLFDNMLMILTFAQSLSIFYKGGCDFFRMFMKIVIFSVNQSWTQQEAGINLRFTNFDRGQNFLGRLLPEM